MHHAFLTPKVLISASSVTSVVSWRSPRQPPKAHPSGDSSRLYLGYLAPQNLLVALGITLPATSWHVQDFWVSSSVPIYALYRFFLIQEMYSCFVSSNLHKQETKNHQYIHLTLVAQVFELRRSAISLLRV